MPLFAKAPGFERLFLWLLAALPCLLFVPGLAADPFRAARDGMVDEIRDEVKLTRQYIDRSTLDDRVMDAMSAVPRHHFVPDDAIPHAYENRPLSIGHGQTISQPFIVALMTDLLEIDPGQRVLEIGTGSGYQAAILSKLAGEVYTIEIIAPLSRQAAERFERLGYANIRSRLGDGYYGWQAHAPFDAIIVTAAAGHVPPPLIEQLSPGGRLVLPVGSPFQTQQLVLVEKTTAGELRTRQILPVRFVPLTGEHGTDQ